MPQNRTLVNGVVMIRALIVSVGLLATGASVGAFAAEAQSQQGAEQAASATSSAAKPKPKKVWTNDDMAGLTGTISVVGTPRQRTLTAPSGISSFQSAVPTNGSPGKAPDAKSKDGSVDPKTLEQLRQQLQKLQANIDQLDKQIEQLEGASHGDSKNLGVLTSDPSRYSMEPVPDQIKALEAKKSSLQAAMDQLLDAARASGIEPGQLR
jgi:hypothetical protein